jgi:predicted TIM-barrel fold metal-dependent hydrolase
MCANYRAFNRWLEEDWGYGSDGRIYGVPILTLIDLDWAIKEIERVADLGARIFWLSHHPVNGKSLADPYFDPFWARVEERGLKLAFHTGFEGFTYHYGTLWGEDPKRPLPAWSSFQHYIGTGTRPIMDAFAALILHNLFGRFPGIEALTIECGSRWVPRLLEELDKAAKIGAMGVQLGGPLTDTPSNLFRRHVHVNPFWEEPVDELIDAIGADRILFGSDFPHPEGLTTPLDKAQHLLDAVSESDFRKIMRDNALALLTS